MQYPSINVQRTTNMHTLGKAAELPYGLAKQRAVQYNR